MEIFYTNYSLLFFFSGIIIGSLITWFTGRQKMENVGSSTELFNENRVLLQELGALQAELQAEKRIFSEKLSAYEDAENRLKDTFQSLSSKVLKDNMASFFEMSKASFDKLHAMSQHDLKERQSSISQMLDPFKDRLKSMDEKLLDLEKSRIGAYTSIQHQIKEMLVAQDKLANETSALSRALNMPSAKGRWGEVQLRRLVELAGMLPHCDFIEQPQQEDAEGRRYRPDMLIKLPNDKQIILDAKVPIKAYLEAQETHNDLRKKSLLQEYVKHLRFQIKTLSSKAYWQQFGKSPEFVILFLPADPFLGAALETDPTLMEDAFSQNIVMATPATLMAILQSMAFGWQQATMAEKIHEIRGIGQNFYAKFTALSDELERLGRQLRLSVKSYNKSVDVLNDQLSPLARKLGEGLGKDTNQLEKPSSVEVNPILKNVAADAD